MTGQEGWGNQQRCRRRASCRSWLRDQRGTSTAITEPADRVEMVVVVVVVVG